MFRKLDFWAAIHASVNSVDVKVAPLLYFDMPNPDKTAISNAVVVTVYVHFSEFKCCYCSADSENKNMFSIRSFYKYYGLISNTVFVKKK